jgi:predicted Co/Zn/Cd cation transporter (cation efflux family)
MRGRKNRMRETRLARFFFMPRGFAGGILFGKEFRLVLEQLLAVMGISFSFITTLRVVLPKGKIIKFSFFSSFSFASFLFLFLLTLLPRAFKKRLASGSRRETTQ